MSIVEKQDEFAWGKSVVKNLAEDLQQEFVGIKGFSVQNLWNMRLFYLEYHKNTKLQPLVREISWTKNVLINHIGVSNYHLSATLPKELQSFLPSSKEIAERLSLFDESEKPDDQ